MSARLVRLDYLRGFAALYVCVAHLANGVLGLQNLATIPFRFGQEAVVLFFLISGFVIYYSYEQAADKRFSTYLRQRARRIFPMFAVALCLSYVVAVDQPDAGLDTLVWNLLMLQDTAFAKPGVWAPAYAGNLPLWSLSYEWWFYLLFFPVRRFVPGRLQKYLAVALSVTAIVVYNMVPNQPCLFLGYFAIWWTGAELARTYCDGTGPGWENLFPVAVVTAAFAVPAIFAVLRGTAFAPGLHPFLELRHAGFGLIAVATGLVWRRWRWRGFDPIFATFGAVAPISYALYLFHFPLISWRFAGLLPEPLDLVGCLMLLVAMSAVLEGPVQSWVNRRFSWRAPPPVPLQPVFVSGAERALNSPRD